MAIVALVASGKGGAGKSVVTAFLGEALASCGMRVLAAELDSGLRSLDVAFGLTKDIVFDLGDVMRGSSELKDAIYSCPFCERLSLIAAAARPVAVPATFICEMSSELSDCYDFILLDCPAGIGYAVEYAAAAANFALVVATPDMTSIRGSHAVSETMENYGLTSQRLIINRVPPKPKMLEPLSSLDEVIDGSGVQLIGALWDDPCTRSAFSMGVSLPSDSPNSSPFINIARRISGQYVPLSIK